MVLQDRLDRIFSDSWQFWHPRIYAGQEICVHLRSKGCQVLCGVVTNVLSQVPMANHQTLQQAASLFYGWESYTFELIRLNGIAARLPTPHPDSAEALVAIKSSNGLAQVVSKMEATAIHKKGYSLLHATAA